MSYVDKQRCSGKIKYYNELSAYGFISVDSNEDVFFHRNDSELNPDELVKGKDVTFTVVFNTPKGKWKAIDVKFV